MSVRPYILVAVYFGIIFSSRGQCDTELAYIDAPNGLVIRCPNGKVLLKLAGVNNVTSAWFKDEVRIAEGPTQIQVSEPGTYSVVICEFLYKAATVHVTYDNTLQYIDFCKSGVIPSIASSNAIPEVPGTVKNALPGPDPSCFIFCANESNRSLIASPGFDTYDWYIDGVPQMETSNVIQVNKSGVYRVDGFKIDGTTCSVSFEHYVTLAPPPAKPIITSKVSNCITGSILLEPTSIAYGSYHWYNESNQLIGFGPSFIATGPGKYKVNVTDYNTGCTSEFSDLKEVIIQAPPAKPSIAVYGDLAICPSGSVDLEGPAGFAAYIWSNGATSRRITVTNPGSYTLIVKDIRDCASPVSDKVNVIPKSLLKPSITIYGNTTFCLGGSVDLEGPAGFKIYSWSNGATSRRITVSASGNYTLKVTSFDDCVSSFSDAVQVNALTTPELSFTLDKNNLRSYSFLKLTIANYNPNYAYSIDWKDGEVTTADNATEEHVYTLAGTYSISVEATNEAGCKTTATKNVTVYTPMCATIVPSKSKGEFKLNKKTGQIVFVRNDNCPSTIKIGCISTDGQADILHNVVAASATTFADVWNYDVAAYNKYGAQQSTAANDFERGKLGKWRPRSIYTYKTTLSDKSLNYEAGTFDLEIFSWKSELSNNPKTWLKTNTIEKYSPHGEPLQERNILGIASAAKFGYFDALPYLTIQNADAESAFFESFENSYGTALEDGFVPTGGEIATGGAHAGKKSYKLTGSKVFKLPAFKVKAYRSKGMLVKFWVKVSGFDNQKNLVNLLKINSQEITALQSVKVVAQTGEWILCQKYFTDFGGLTDGQNFTPTINYSGTGEIWLDDIRLQPADAQMTAYVYDARTLKLLTVFDDQHFGLYYQYNAEGKLVRKQVETEKGAKTIQETQYNIPKNTDPIPLN